MGGIKLRGVYPLLLTRICRTVVTCGLCQTFKRNRVMAKGKDKQKSSEKKKPLKTLLEKRKDKKDKKDGSGRSL